MIRPYLSSILANLPGWRTNRKIIVIESDDWGNIRMPSRYVYEKLNNAGLGLNVGDGLRYSLFDSLETSTDLISLFQILDSFKDINNSTPVFTALCVTANPDFEKIKEGGFQQFYYEPFTETLKKYNGNDATYKLYHDGIIRNVFIPQFHGREHLYVQAWMKALKASDHETHIAFNEGMWAFAPKQSIDNGIEYEAAFQLSDISELEMQKKILTEGLEMFEKLFGYKAEYFVPPNGRINNKLNYICKEKGIRFRSTTRIQHETIGNGQTKKILHWLGEKEVNGIRYIIRNCLFEPSLPGKDWVDSCLNDIKRAFQWHKPAIISTHRVNYIGVHDVSNRDRGLKDLQCLLKAIERNWSNIEFMTTIQLGALIEESYS